MKQVADPINNHSETHSVTETIALRRWGLRGEAPNKRIWLAKFSACYNTRHSSRIAFKTTSREKV